MRTKSWFKMASIRSSCRKWWLRNIVRYFFLFRCTSKSRESVYGGETKFYSPNTNSPQPLRLVDFARHPKDCNHLFSCNQMSTRGSNGWLPKRDININRKNWQNDKSHAQNKATPLPLLSMHAISHCICVFISKLCIDVKVRAGFSGLARDGAELYDVSVRSRSRAEERLKRTDPNDCFCENHLWGETQGWQQHSAV